jgi:acetolactate synthase I/II/III large subunit
MKNDYDGGEAILEALRRLKVDYIVSSPGSEWPSLWEAMARQKRDGSPGPTYLDCGHEILAITLAAGYTKVTGRMQVVLLHAGAGLLQGSMAVGAARAMEVPMLVMSGEAGGYGESAFDPGSQWYRNLSVIGGPQRLLEPLVKFAQQAPAPEILYESVVRAGELAQRQPKGPTYLCVSMETMLQGWQKPDVLRSVPAAPKSQPLYSEIESVAAKIARAKNPIIAAENAGPSIEAFNALIELVDLAAIPVVEGQGAFFGNFPKNHDLYLGSQIGPFYGMVDLVLLVETRAPWYPPSNAPPGAEIISISENALKSHMVYQVMHAGQYLEGDVATTLKLLSEALRSLGVEYEKVAERRARWAAEHRKWEGRLRAAEENAVSLGTITTPLLAKTLREVMPPDTAYVDETIVHAIAIREHLDWRDPLTFFRAPSGLGQGLGYALGVKLATPQRPVVVLIGDGTFMYNPVVPAIAFADERRLPLLIVVANNAKYGAMQHFHDIFYPNGIATANQDYYGVYIKGPKYEEAAKMVGGYAMEVARPADLRPALEDALKSVESGKTAILNVMMPAPDKLR